MRAESLRVRLLGGFGIATASGAVLSLPGPRQRSLVAYLLLHRDTPSDRKHLAFLLWPDSSEQQALTNLRQLIHEVRAALPDAERFIESGRRLVRWRGDAPCTVDADDFEAALAAAEGAAAAGAEGVAALSRAVALYADDLLPECYDEWIEPFRQRLRQGAAGALRRLVHLLEARRDYGAALPHAERLLGLNPLDETSTLTLMRLRAADGQRAGALDAYQRSEELLRRELGVAPGPALRELRDRLARATTTAAGAVERPPFDAPPFRLVGRGAEWARLTRAWGAAAHVPPRCVLLSGVAGIGKTRLAEELVLWADRQGASVATARCYGTVGGLPYAAVADWLRSPPVRRAVASLPDVWRAELATVLPELAADGTHPAAPRDRAPPEARRRLFEAVARAIGAAPPPLLLLLDDIQWADRETLEWVRYFLAGADAARVLVLATLRSGEVPLEARLDTVLRDLARDGRLEEIALEPLAPSETAALGAAAASQLTLDAAAARELHRETEGHPLYIVEQMRARITSGTGGEGSPAPSAAPRPLPQRVLAVIESRLAQLSAAARTAVGVASVIGREFRLELLANASGTGDEEVASAVDELCARRLVRERGDSAYDFSHDRIREVAYASLGDARRRLLHQRIARAQMVSAAGASGSAAAIAKHLERGGLIAGAIPYYRLAAEQALDVYASGEAVRLIERALALLSHLPASPGRLAQEIDLRTALCVTIVNVEMYSARILEEYARLRAICDPAGLAPGPPAHRMAAIALVMKGEMAEAADIGQRLLRAAPAAENPLLFVEAEYVLGVTAFWMGDPVASVGHLEAALGAYRPEQAREHIIAYGQDAGVICGVRLAQALWTIGRVGPARRALDDALARAEALTHPHTLAYARQFGAWTLIDMGDEAAARWQIEGAIELAEAHALSGWPIRNRALYGFLLARGGEAERGIAMMRESADEWARRGWHLAVPYDRALLAELYLAAGQLDEGFRAVEEGMADARQTGQTFWDAELLRLRAELLAAAGSPDEEVERVLRDAREVAARQGAEALAERAVESLQRLGRAVSG